MCNWAPFRKSSPKDSLVRSVHLVGPLRKKKKEVLHSLPLFCMGLFSSTPLNNDLLSPKEMFCYFCVVLEPIPCPLPPSSLAMLSLFSLATHPTGPVVDQFPPLSLETSHPLCLLVWLCLHCLGGEAALL